MCSFDDLGAFLYTQLSLIAKKGWSMKVWNSFLSWLNPVPSGLKTAVLHILCFQQWMSSSIPLETVFNRIIINHNNRICTVYAWYLLENPVFCSFMSNFNRSATYIIGFRILIQIYEWKTYWYLPISLYRT